MNFCVLAFVVCAAAATHAQEQVNSTTRVIYLHVISEIQSRFAITDVLSEVENIANVSKELSFTARLPDAAFISNFSMEVNGVVTYGEVKEKAKAKAIFDRARSRGLTAGHVAESARETNVFTISVNVAAESKAKFNLTYQEVLKRVHGVYKHVLNIQADQQDVEQVQIDVLIAEREKIKTLRVPKFGAKVGEKTNKQLLKSPEEAGMTKRISNGPHGSVGFVTYSPPASSLKSGGKQLAVLYDVDRQNDGGAIEVINGYFVHFFAPSGIPPGDKNVIFVLDKSGSMTGRKFLQLQEAMSTILADLHPSDSFNVMMFSSGHELWNNASVAATKENIELADIWVQEKSTGGGTQLHAAISEATRLLLQDSRASGAPLTSTIIYLTDGQASVDVKKLTEENKLRFSMHGVAFGDGADLRLLRRISSANNGLTRKVYEHADAPLQLTGFYQEISTPLLRDVKVKYVNETVDVSSLVGNAVETGGIYYSGSEFVTVGRVSNETTEDKVVAEITGRSKATKPFLKKVDSSKRRPSAVAGSSVVDTSPPLRCHPVAVGSGAFAFSAESLPDLRRFRHIPLCEDFSKPLNQPLLGSATVGGFVERMWAYMTIKKYLKEADLADDHDKREELTKKALDTSLKYSFVTKLTSMVVVPPDQEGTNKTAVADELTDEIKEREASFDLSAARALPGVGGGGGGFLSPSHFSSGSAFGPAPPLGLPVGGLSGIGGPFRGRKRGPLPAPAPWQPGPMRCRGPGCIVQQAKPVLPSLCQGPLCMGTAAPNFVLNTATPPTTTPGVTTTGSNNTCNMHVVFIIDQRLKADVKSAVGNAVRKLTSQLENDFANVHFAVYQQYRNNGSLKEIANITAGDEVVKGLFGVEGIHRPSSYLSDQFVSPNDANIIVHAIAEPMFKSYAENAPSLLKARATYLVMTPKSVKLNVGFTPDAFVDMPIPTEQYEAHFHC